MDARIDKGLREYLESHDSQADPYGAAAGACAIILEWAYNRSGSMNEYEADSLEKVQRALYSGDPSLFPTVQNLDLTD